MADVASVNENVTGWYSEMFASGASRVLLFPQESLLAGPLFPSFAFCTSCPLVCLRLCHPCHPAAKPILNQFGGSYDNICPLAYLWSMMSMLCTLKLKRLRANNDQVALLVGRAVAAMAHEGGWSGG